MPAPLRLFLRLSLAITVPTWAIAIATIPTRTPRSLLYPFLDDNNPFYDIWIFFARFQHLHTPLFFAPTATPFGYFPAGIPFFAALYRWGVNVALLLYLTLCPAIVLAGAVLFGRALRRAGLPPRPTERFLLASVCCSFPILFAFQRGNLELPLAAGITLGTCAFFRGRPTLAALLWGVFGAVKLYPLLLAALFLARHRLQLARLLLTLGTAAAATVLSLLYTGPTFAAARAGLRRGPTEFLTDYSLALRSLEWDHSLFALLKRLAAALHLPLAPLLVPYLVLAGAAMLLVFFLRIRHLPLPNQLVALSVALVLLPPTSFEYTLTELTGAWGLLVLLALHYPAAPGLRPALALLAVLFCPLRLVAFHAAGQLQTLLLLALLVTALRFPWPDSPTRLTPPFLYTHGGSRYPQSL